MENMQGHDTANPVKDKTRPIVRKELPVALHHGSWVNMIDNGIHQFLNFFLRSCKNERAELGTFHRTLEQQSCFGLSNSGQSPSQSKKPSTQLTANVRWSERANIKHYIIHLHSTYTKKVWDFESTARTTWTSDDTHRSQVRPTPTVPLLIGTVLSHPKHNFPRKSAWRRWKTTPKRQLFV